MKQIVKFEILHSRMETTSSKTYVNFQVFVDEESLASMKLSTPINVLWK